jgi:hypothetical protein
VKPKRLWSSKAGKGPDPFSRSGGESFLLTPREFAEKLERKAEDFRREKAEKQAASTARD